MYIGKLKITFNRHFRMYELGIKYHPKAKQLNINLIQWTLTFWYRS